jgi:hypothetical protein
MTLIVFIMMLTCAMLVPALIVLVPGLWYTLPEDVKRRFFK